MAGHGRFGDFGDMFLKLLKDDGEVWDTHFIYEKDSPPDEVLAQYQASMSKVVCINLPHCSVATYRHCILHIDCTSFSVYSTLDVH